MPTITNLLGISLDKHKYIHFGQDLLNYENNLIGMKYYLPTGSLINENILFIPGTGQKEPKIYDLKSKKKIKNIKKYINSCDNNYNKMLMLYDWSDSYLNSLPKRY